MDGVAEENLTNRLAAEALAAGDPTGWFERVYAAAEAGVGDPPWNRSAPRDLLVDWARARGLRGDGRRALVVGSGLGADAEYVAGLGFDTVAFDISATAVRMARARFPDTRVDYRTADLLDPPEEWLQAFDLVVEIFTVQALPDPPRARAIANVGAMVAAGGTLIAIAVARADGEAPGQGPPWPLARTEIEAFAHGTLAAAGIETIAGLWRAEFRRAG
jgi:SAM-dependent methyltransferase